ncbi:PIN domain-containing protein [Candidatus Woesearchaeota archaeon]|nr:PIN domain-containing protein [Candidatus Woesearchaeota archaeon]
MGLTTYFFDTYAFLEIVKGSKEYEEYLDSTIITTKLNLLELHYILLKERGIVVADAAYNFFCEYTIDVTDNAIRESSKFRYKHKEKNFSYIDCIGYIIARMHNIPFLTGDKAFKGMEGVEFVR